MLWTWLQICTCIFAGYLETHTHTLQGAERRFSVEVAADDRPNTWYIEDQPSSPTSITEFFCDDPMPANKVYVHSTSGPLELAEVLICAKVGYILPERE